MWIDRSIRNRLTKNNLCSKFYKNNFRRRKSIFKFFGQIYLWNLPINVDIMIIFDAITYFYNIIRYSSPIYYPLMHCCMSRRLKISSIISFDQFYWCFWLIFHFCEQVSDPSSSRLHIKNYPKFTEISSFQCWYNCLHVKLFKVRFATILQLIWLVNGSPAPKKPRGILRKCDQKNTIYL